MVYVYAITESAGLAAEAPLGLEERPLAALGEDGVGAVFSRHPADTRIAHATQNFWKHEQVVEWLMRGYALLPARFGTIFPDEAGLAAALGRNRERLAAGIERVRGCVELGVRVMRESIDSPAAVSRRTGATSGREYMAARLEEERKRRDDRAAAEHVAGALHAPLASLATDSTRRVLPAPQVVMIAAYLVSRDRADAFRQTVRELAERRPGVRVLCTGPWPPYHFVPSLGDAGRADHG